MDTARQVVRWSIPGAVVAVALATYEAIVAMLVGRPETYLGGLTESADLAPLVAIAIFGSIALGYVIYQFYYASYGRVVYRPTWIVSRDRGLHILKHLGQGDPPYANKSEEDVNKSVRAFLDEVELWTAGVPDATDHSSRGRGGLRVLTDKSPEGLKRIRGAHQGNWAIVRCLIDLVTVETESDRLYSEYTTLSDIYHSLGASRVAVVVSLPIYCAANLANYTDRWDWSEGSSYLGAAAVLSVAIALFAVFETNRRNAWRSVTGTLSLGLRFYLPRLRAAYAPQPQDVRGSFTE